MQADDPCGPAEPEQTSALNLVGSTQALLQGRPVAVPVKPLPDRVQIELRRVGPAAPPVAVHRLVVLKVVRTAYRHDRPFVAVGEPRLRC